MIKHGFKRSLYDSCVYLSKLENGIYIYLLLYVDDILIASPSMKEIQKLKLSSEFDMKDHGAAAKKILEIYRGKKRCSYVRKATFRNC